MRLRRAVCGAIFAALAGACATPPATAPAAPATTAPAPPATVSAPAAVSTATAERFALANPGFESTVRPSSGDPDGWYAHQHAGEKSYRFVVDDEAPHTGPRSLRLENIGPEPYGAIGQIIDARPHGGKVARLSGWLRTRDASDGGAGLTLVAQQGGAIIDHNFMYDAAVRGTTGWQRFTITVPVATRADRLEVGAMLRGKGALWLDDVELEFISP
jgi:hypothetical protein